MKRTKVVTGLLSLAALFVLGTLAATSASAASEFLWSGALPGLILVLSTNAQLFAFEPGGTIFTCKHFGARATTSNGSAMTTKEIVLTGLYSKCEFVGVNTKVSPVEFLLTADGSIAVIGKPIVLTFGGIFNCSVKIDSGAANRSLKTIKFLNAPQSHPAAVLAHVEIAGFTSLSSGGECGTPGEERREGLFRGLWLLFVDGGTLRWDP